MRHNTDNLKGDVVLNTRIQMYVSRQPAERKETHMLELQKMLSNKIAAFTEFSHKERLLMCFNFEYLNVGPGRVIIKEGQPAQNYYIILSGQVEITQILDQNTLLRVVRFAP
jgi:hypothetical protein